MLSNFEISKITKQHNIKLNYVGYKDLIPAKKYKTFNGIINMDSSDPNDIGGPSGTHWVSLIIRNNQSIYVDSFGCIEPLEIKEFVNQNGLEHFGYNTTQIQDIKDDHCGYYCIALLLFIKHNKGELYDVVDKFINLFDSNTKKNAKILRNYLTSNGVTC